MGQEEGYPCQCGVAVVIDVETTTRAYRGGQIKVEPLMQPSKAHRLM